jgi:hypothetical protein
VPIKDGEMNLWSTELLDTQCLFCSDRAYTGTSSIAVDTVLFLSKIVFLIYSFIVQ